MSITLLVVGVTFGTYLLIAWLSRVRDTSGFYVAGRGVPAIANSSQGIGVVGMLIDFGVTLRLTPLTAPPPMRCAR